MHGHGHSLSPGSASTWCNPPDHVERKLPDLEAYQFGLASRPRRREPSTRRRRPGGRGVQRAGPMRQLPLRAQLTDANALLHPTDGSRDGPDPCQRSATKMYRTTPLRGLWQHAPYFHDGRAADTGGRGRATTSAKNLKLTPDRSRGSGRVSEVALSNYDLSSGPIRTIGDVGLGRAGRGSTVIAAALDRAVRRHGICSTLAWPSGSGLNVTEGTGLPS